MSIREWTSRHPQLTAWAALAVGMVIILIIAARDVGLLASQWAALIVATILLAGLCVWIIGWDAGDDEEEDDDRNGETGPDAQEVPEDDDAPEGIGEPQAIGAPEAEGEAQSQS